MDQEPTDQEFEECAEEAFGVDMCEICGALVGEKHVFSCPADPTWRHEWARD